MSTTYIEFYSLHTVVCNSSYINDSLSFANTLISLQNRVSRWIPSALVQIPNCCIVTAGFVTCQTTKTSQRSTTRSAIYRLQFHRFALKRFTGTWPLQQRSFFAERTGLKLNFFCGPAFEKSQML